MSKRLVQWNSGMAGTRAPDISARVTARIQHWTSVLVIEHFWTTIANSDNEVTTLRHEQLLWCSSYTISALLIYLPACLLTKWNTKWHCIFKFQIFIQPFGYSAANGQIKLSSDQFREHILSSVIFRLLAGPAISVSRKSLTMTKCPSPSLYLSDLHEGDLVGIL